MDLRCAVEADRSSTICARTKSTVERSCAVKQPMMGSCGMWFPFHRRSEKFRNHLHRPGPLGITRNFQKRMTKPAQISPRTRRGMQYNDLCGCGSWVYDPYLSTIDPIRLLLATQTKVSEYIRATSHAGRMPLTATCGASFFRAF